MITKNDILTLWVSRKDNEYLLELIVLGFLAIWLITWNLIISFCKFIIMLIIKLHKKLMGEKKVKQAQYSEKKKRTKKNG